MEAVNRQPTFRQVPVNHLHPQPPVKALGIIAAQGALLRWGSALKVICSPIQMRPQPGNQRPCLLALRQQTVDGRGSRARGRWSGGKTASTAAA